MPAPESVRLRDDEHRRINHSPGLRGYVALVEWRPSPRGRPYRPSRSMVHGCDADAARAVGRIARSTQATAATGYVLAVAASGRVVEVREVAP